MISTERFFTGDKAAITDGRTKVVFDFPADFADWLEANPDVVLPAWQWCRP